MSDPTSWDLTLGKIQLALNRTVQSSTGKTPSNLFFGYQIRGPYDSLMSLLKENERAEEFIQKRTQDREEASHKIVTAQMKNKERYDAKRRAYKKFKEGRIGHDKKNNTSYGTKSEDG